MSMSCSSIKANLSAECPSPYTRGSNHSRSSLCRSGPFAMSFPLNGQLRDYVSSPHREESATPCSSERHGGSAPERVQVDDAARQENATMDASSFLHPGKCAGRT